MLARSSYFQPAAFIYPHTQKLEEMKPNIPMKYAFFILVAGTLLASGCMGPNTVNPEGEWIILPASEVWPEYSGYTSLKQRENDH